MPQFALAPACVMHPVWNDTDGATLAVCPRRLYPRRAEPRVCLHGDAAAFVALPDSLPLGPLRNLIDLALGLMFSGHSLFRSALRQ
jgi:hypothetical protein